jgi:hypothetical protein
MRWFGFFVASILGPSIAAAAQPLFVLDCEVKYQTVIGSEEGKPKIYSGYTNQFVTSDNLDFTLKPSGNGLYAYLQDNKRDKVVISAKSLVLKENPVKIVLDYSGLPSLKWSDDYSKMVFSSDRIYLSTPRSNLVLDRYYKSDFHGLLFVQSPAMMLQVVTLDCRTVLDQFDQIVASFK